jgi:hypothetical protein
VLNKDFKIDIKGGRMLSTKNLAIELKFLTMRSTPALMILPIIWTNWLVVSEAGGAEF